MPPVPGGGVPPDGIVGTAPLGPTWMSPPFPMVPRFPVDEIKVPVEQTIFAQHSPAFFSSLHWLGMLLYFGHLNNNVSFVLSNNLLNTFRNKPLLLCAYINSLPKDKILKSSKFKTHADNKINVTKILKFVLEMVENILGKGENAGNQHFLLFPKCFRKPPSSGSLKVGIVW